MEASVFRSQKIFHGESVFTAKYLPQLNLEMLQASLRVSLALFVRTYLRKNYN